MTLENIGDAVGLRRAGKPARRGELLDAIRLLTRHAAQPIRAIHRGETEAADATLAEAADLLADMRKMVTHHPGLASAGYALDAQKEYSEACLTRALVSGREAPGPQVLGVDDAAWLNGIGEAAGELRRAALDRMRDGAVDEAEVLLRRMEDIHALLGTIDFPSAITRNVKRTHDFVRGVTERTRGDLTLAARPAALRHALDPGEGGVAARRGAPGG